MQIGNSTHGFTEEKDPHWNRREVAGFVSEFEQAAPEVVSDQAKALLAHAAAQNAHHSPDLFHVQQEYACG